MSAPSTAVARDAAGRRRSEHDRGGTLLATLVWGGERLAVASLRLADGNWLTIEPRRGARGAWGESDRLAVSRAPLEAPDRSNAPALTLMSALDWSAIDRIPVVAEPARLPPGAAAAVLNLIASLARDQGRRALAYDGPYAGEALFLALLESFRYDAAIREPLAAFGAGALTWTPAPHERLVVAPDVLVQWRGRVEKVQDGARVYVRPDWQGVRRHAPRRVREEGGDVRCSLVVLDDVVEDHLVLDAVGAMQARPPVEADDPAVQGLPPTVVAGVVAAVAAASAPPLREEIAHAARRRPLAWGPVDRDLVTARDDTLVVSHRVRRALARRLAAAADRSARVGIALAIVAELAALVGDLLRAQAQAALAAAPAEAQARALLATGASADDAARITAAARAVLDAFGR